MYISKSFKTKNIKEDLTITEPRQLAQLAKNLIGDDIELVENFIVISLTGSSKVIRSEVLYRGTLNQSLVHPRDIFRDAIKENAAAVLIAHNHPSGALTPSKSDIAVTKRLIEVGNIVGISIKDHVIIVPNGGYYSFHDRGIL